MSANHLHQETVEISSCRHSNWLLMQEGPRKKQKTDKGSRATGVHEEAADGADTGHGEMPPLTESDVETDGERIYVR